MSQLLEQHNKLIENLRKRDNIIQKSLSSIDNQFGCHRHSINAHSSDIQQLHEDQVVIVARMVGYEERACHCGEGSDRLSDLSYGEPVKTSSSGPSFPGCSTPSPLPIPVPVSHIEGQDVGLPSSLESSSDKENDIPGSHTGDRPLFTDPVLVEYIVVPCPMYQHIPGQEQVEFFQNVPNNVTSTFQLSTLWEYCENI